MAHAHPWRRRSRHLALAAGFGLIALTIPPWHAVLATIPPAGNRQLSVQVTEDQNQQAAGSTGWNSAFTAGQGEGLQYESQSVNWNQLEPSPQTYNYSVIDTIYNYYTGLNPVVPIELRINTIFTCTREVPSDLTSTAWDNSTMISRFETVLLGVYNHLHPSGKTALPLVYLSIGTEVDSTLQYYWSQGSSIDNYMKYKTFFESARTYARGSSLWGTGLQVGLSSTWDGATSSAAESSSNATNAASSGQNQVTFTTLPTTFSVGDYVTIDSTGTHPETKRITATGTSSWTLDSNLVYSHAAGFWAVRTLGNGVQTLNTNSDLVLYSYYMINSDLTVRGDPTTTPYTDIWTIAQMYPNRTMALDEVGYPSSSDLGGTTTKQKNFIDSIFGAWDQYCESQTSCNSPSLKYVDFQWGTDWSQESADLYAIGGCNGASMPQVNTTATSAVAANSSTLTFTSAPAYFANGDVVILDSWSGGSEEAMVISSGAGTTTWTMTGNTVFAHSAGYQVTLRNFHAPTVTPVGTTGSNSWQYYIVASNANGDSLDSQATSISNGNATLSSTNYNTISWTAISGATGYRIFRSATGTGTPSSLGEIGTTTTATSFNDTGVAATSYTNHTQNLASFIGSLGFRTWSGDGSDKGAWGEICTDAKARGWSTRTTC